jgi:hypothetical protein
MNSIYETNGASEAKLGDDGRSLLSCLYYIKLEQHFKVFITLLLELHHNTRQLL